MKLVVEQIAENFNKLKTLQDERKKFLIKATTFLRDSIENCSTCNLREELWDVLDLLEKTLG